MRYGQLLAEAWEQAFNAKRLWITAFIGGSQAADVWLFFDLSGLTSSWQGHDAPLLEQFLQPLSLQWFGAGLARESMQSAGPVYGAASGLMLLALATAVPWTWAVSLMPSIRAGQPSRPAAGPTGCAGRPGKWRTN